MHALVTENADYNLTQMCRLFEVTRQGYHQYVKSLSAPRVARKLVLAEQIRQVYEDSGRRYGSPKVCEALRAMGVRVSLNRVERLMRELGLAGITRRRHKVTTRSNPKDKCPKNLLMLDDARDFTASEPNKRWVTDITYIDTAEGWGYLAAIIDLYSRRIVGWALSASLSTELPLLALERALKARAPKPGLIHHSDRGCQYTSKDYKAALDAKGIVMSMSHRGNCWDNAVAESFFANLKTELIYRQSWKSRDELEDGLFEYIEGFYNTRRLHSAVGYRTPAAAEAAFRTAA